MVCWLGEGRGGRGEAKKSVLQQIIKNKMVKKARLAMSDDIVFVVDVVVVDNFFIVNLTVVVVVIVIVIDVVILFCYHFCCYSVIAAVVFWFLLWAESCVLIPHLPLHYVARFSMITVINVASRCLKGMPISVGGVDQHHSALAQSISLSLSFSLSRLFSNLAQKPEDRERN